MALRQPALISPCSTFRCSKGVSSIERDTGKSERVDDHQSSLAKKYWPKEDPVGQRVTIGKGLGPDFEEPTRQIVGIVGNARESGLTTHNQPAMYVPHAQVTDAITKLAEQPDLDELGDSHVRPIQPR